MDFSTFMQPIVNMLYDILGNPALIGATIFLFVTLFMMMLFIPFEAMVVIWIPLTAALWFYIPVLRIILGICLGFVIGLGLIKWFRR